MANLTRNFIKGRMNKSVDYRLIPNGEYVDAINMRMGSTEDSDIGVMVNEEGNLPLTTLQYNGNQLSTSAKCIGAFEDGANETIYWFIHDSGFTSSPTGLLDLIVSFNTKTEKVKYHVISINDAGGILTTLNFNPSYLITGINIIENLLFFTDNYNPPRVINVKRNYASPDLSSPFYDFAGNAALLKETIQVIKRPPHLAPTLAPLSTPNEENYLVDRYICFGYRWRYEDKEHSATSPMSDPAFLPNTFDHDYASQLNEGMVNKFNAVSVTYNTGNYLVKGIDLLFKEAQNGIIKVIRKINKLEEGLADNDNVTFTFDNSKIYTILPDSEILRLYDNVPRVSLAQTLMGNRLIYGNYIDGYNMVRNGFSTKINYTLDLISEPENAIEAIVTKADTIYSTPDYVTITDSTVRFTFDTSIALTKGSVFTFDLSIIHGGWHPSSADNPTSTTGDFDLSLSFSLPKDYNNIYELATSDEFVNKVGNNLSPTARNIKPVYDPTPANPTSCDGTTFTDNFNCKIANTLPIAIATEFPAGTVTKYSSAIDYPLTGGVTPWLNNRPLLAVAGVDYIEFRLLYMNFVGVVADPFPDGTAYVGTVQEFYRVVSASANLTSSGNLKSLHSNRNYEVGIVYLDDYARASTALVSKNNTIHIPCSNSTNLNVIQATIPVEQLAPEWASYYKFVIKPDEENYDVIYSNTYYRNEDDGMAYLKLEGENSQKIEDGDRLIVKSDSSGPQKSCSYTTVLSKETYISGAIVTGSLPGVYMKINPNTLDLTADEYAVVDYGTQYTTQTIAGNFPVIPYPMSVKNSSGDYYNYDVPAGSTVVVEIDMYRTGKGNSCEQRQYVLSATMRATVGYADMFDFLVGENFQAVLDTGTTTCGGGCTISNVFLTEKDPSPSPTPALGTNYYWWVSGTTSVASTLVMSGTRACEGISRDRDSAIKARFKVNRADQAIIFETEPSDALPDVWYESADTYGIEVSTGYHLGNIRSQTASLPAIVTTDFYNCFAFGNGAESYKIRDSIIGKTFNLGNRIYTTSEQEYRESRRFADLTYSGVYNQETNVNKLNEFNIGLLNYKPLEQSFGSVQKLLGRETDILTLQEDKISYVLQGKNLLSDAGAGSALTSVPEVLGTQIARIEDHGISHHPESFSVWGAYKCFTDAKRGAVIQLIGSSAQNEQLTVISEQGMRPWFRNLFIDSFDTQKIGAFDPYMNEYVLTSNDILKPQDPSECIECGETLEGLVSTETAPSSFCVELGQLVGTVTISYVVADGSSAGELRIIYNGTTTPVAIPSGGGTYSTTFEKNSAGANSVTIEAQPGVMDPPLTISSITVGCPDAEDMVVIPVCFTSDSESGSYIHNEYSWTDGIYTSPTHSELVQFIVDGVNTPIVSDYRTIAAPQGAGVVPADGATVKITANKIGFDDFVFDPTKDKFRYFRTNFLYGNNDSDMRVLLAASTLVTPIVPTSGPQKYFAEFTMPTTGIYLYLVWDYRISTAEDLCFGSTLSTACCGC